LPVPLLGLLGVGNHGNFNQGLFNTGNYNLGIGLTGWRVPVSESTRF
jgi:hypothetical protein